ncbi:DNA-binding NarL/FixJ family response regulator [Paenibacillus endophyticus]|uniref:DNA-binding NarL/FixJ family response regulator n=1 Tax=Paenibacillus endophyticus TaxID=1294268 RepID=A0A7W5CBQ3_9BACL|nr:LuxR C-terminal-related transcriptional regulator [Paenibacillus endophyticus]MBB3154753.1 DNA-binding NarL/FixJ family response regulator [Paenibacillus endophyticus]
MKLTYEDRKPSLEELIIQKCVAANEALEHSVAQKLNCSMQEFSLIYRLTQRESEILALSVIHGFSNREISEKCVISEKTVKNHLANLMNKIGAHSMRKLFSMLLHHALSAKKNHPDD